MTETSAGNGTGTQAVDRAALLVSTVVRADEPLTFADLQEECGLAKSTTSRMLSALERTGLLQRNDAGSFRPAASSGSTPRATTRGQDLVRLARPTLDRIGEATHETVNLSVARGHQVVQVAQVDSRFLIGAPNWIEVDVPVALLGARQGASSPSAWSRLPPSPSSGRPPRRSPSPTTAPRRRAARRRGWAVTLDELELGLTAVAVPVHGHHGTSSPPSASPGRPARMRRAGSTSSAAAPRPRPRSSRPCWAAEPARRVSRDDPGGDPAGALRRDPRRQRAARPRAHQRGARARHGAGDAAVRRADPVAGGGRRPLRARRLLRPRDADRRQGDDRRAGASCARCSPRPAPRPSARS